MELTFVMIKPDGVERGLVGEIVSRFERRGLILARMKHVSPSRELVEEHYVEHKKQPYYDNLIKFTLSGPVVVMVLAKANAVSMVRKMVGDTNPDKAIPGTIRGDLASGIPNNVIHASDSTDAAEREINLWFGDDKDED